MTAIAFQGAVELGLIYGLVALGLFLSYRILNLADLTVEGSFILGATASIMLALNEHPYLGLFIALIAGGAAGFITALLQTKLKIQAILAGILTMTGLYSINLRVMNGKASENVIGKDSAFTPFVQTFGNSGKLIFIALAAAIVTLLLILFLGTQTGLSIRATGDNPNMVKSSSVNVHFTKSLGLILANAMVGLSGGILAQYQQSADANMGVGVIVTGLASLIIGEVLVRNLLFAIFKKKNMLTGAISAVLGAIIYRVIIALVLRYTNLPALRFLSITASDMKLLSSLIVILAISYPVIQKKLRLANQKRRLRNAASP